MLLHGLFFRHLKDEITLKECKNIDKVKEEVDEHIKYYNEYRCQWNLKKMTPVEYRNHLFSII
ncbi:IS3 family transposase [Cellulosilyticum ruminicola]|uniref:IS3 family transposase n=1 Tax=Cellulosilyticum ruminicola TaxID=425254 RepID=UPI0006D24B0D|nr:IS3 family transposase [Cellulosilyticum ruminicola]